MTIRMFEVAIAAFVLAAAACVAPGASTEGATEATTEATEATMATEATTDRSLGDALDDAPGDAFDDACCCSDRPIWSVREPIATGRPPAADAGTIRVRCLAG
jgi:hypothetical protein